MMHISIVYNGTKYVEAVTRTITFLLSKRQMMKALVLLSMITILISTVSFNTKGYSISSTADTSSSSSSSESWRSRSCSRGQKLCHRFQTVLMSTRPKGFGSKGKGEIFFCDSCGAEHINWVGRCNSCKEWNTVKQFRVPKSMPPMTGTRNFMNVNTKSSSSVGWVQTDKAFLNADKESMVEMSNVDISIATSRIKVWSEELNRVLGGGLVKGSVVLLAGEPGIGKSTLLLQLASNIANSQEYSSVVYMSGEENKEQVASRAHRLGLNTENLFLICDGDVDSAIEELLLMTPLPSLVIVDSVQTMWSSSCQGGVGSVIQIRDATSTFVRFAKSMGTAVLLAGHVTKTGEVAGPRLLEHMVDTVLYLEGSERADYRLLRGIKNRFGSTAEIGVYTMEAHGLEDVLNPSELFMSSAVISEGVEGAAVVVLVEGTRPLLAEVQCLVGEYSPLKIPKRTADGFPLQRLQLICAVLQKQLGIDLSSREIYINVVGGLKINDPDADLAVATTIVSSFARVKVRPGIALIGELGLGGEVRGGRGVEIKTREAVKMGFSHLIAPISAISAKDKFGNLKLSKELGVESNVLLPCRDIMSALSLAFGTKDLNFLKKKKATSGRAKHPIETDNSDSSGSTGDYRDKGYFERVTEKKSGSLREVFPSSDFRFSDEKSESTSGSGDDDDDAYN